jgi:hypothetical protein
LRVFHSLDSSLGPLAGRWVFELRLRLRVFGDQNLARYDGGHGGTNAFGSRLFLADGFLISVVWGLPALLLPVIYQYLFRSPVIPR